MIFFSVEKMSKDKIVRREIVSERLSVKSKCFTLAKQIIPAGPRYITDTNKQYRKKGETNYNTKQVHWKAI